jgi:hypothetical protein
MSILSLRSEKREKMNRHYELEAIKTAVPCPFIFAFFEAIHINIII